MSLAEHCVYTIVHADRLAKAERRGRPTTFNEAKRWVTAHKLWQRARKSGVEMAVLFADATDCSRLLHWGLLTDLDISDSGTSFTVDRVRPLPTGHSPQELVLRSSGERIASSFIRPYAVCQTPDFVSG